MSKVFLSFFLGPVKPSIEAARTLRDLWTGSYLLSWLTAAALEPVLDFADRGKARLITPDVTDNPMVDAFRRRRKRDPRTAVPSIPNKFTAEITGSADELAKECVRRCEDEWDRICTRVHDRLNDIFKSDGTDKWDRNWSSQVKSYFEVRCIALPLTPDGSKALDRLEIYPRKDEWTRQMLLVGAMMDMTRGVRHTPDYQPEPDSEGRFPVKCSILGSFEQMGPAELNASKEFWKQVATNWKGIGGTRLQKSDRLCAIGLVKRFAWPIYFAPPDRLDLPVSKLRFSDTATLAARRWLETQPKIEPEALRDEEGAWNGQWLHWTRDDQGMKDGDPQRPDELGKRIREKIKQHGKPPTYYALLSLDGDDMGKLFQGEKSHSSREEGADRYQRITGRLTRFALTVRPVVLEHHGELIYAGGDDALILLPADEVIACARELRDLYRSAEYLGEQATTSAGIAVVHIKEDLRFALQTVREAERKAKRFGDKRKDALALTVCRRSGEHTTAFMAWPHTDPFNKLVEAFRNGASDRWAYKLRGELPTLLDLPWPVSSAEVKRLLGHSEGIPEVLPETVGTFMQNYYNEMVVQRGREGADSLTDFVVLCQSASFLARGRD
jgi:CRISPR-associated protein Cmr2